MNKIIISIVTVTYNCENDIEITLDSLLDQFKNIDSSSCEYIVVDGNSKDNTLKIVNKYFEKFNKLGISTRIISEKDSGIYDAMNKGIKLSEGKYINMLNAGDKYHDDKVLKKVIARAINCNNDVIYGKTIRFSNNFKEEWVPGDINMIKKHMIFCHQSTFIKRNLPEHYYNLKYKYCADYDLLLRIYLNKGKFEYIDDYIADYSLDGVTANKKIVETYKEIRNIQVNNGVIKKTIPNFISYSLGIIKRRIILFIPKQLKNSITKILNIFRKKRYY